MNLTMQNFIRPTAFQPDSEIGKSRDRLFGQEQRRKILPYKQDTEQKVPSPCKFNAGQDGDYQLLFG